MAVPARHESNGVARRVWRLLFSTDRASFLSKHVGCSVLSISIECRRGQRTCDISDAFLAAVSYSAIFSFIPGLLSHQHDDYLFGCAKFSACLDSTICLECSGRVVRRVAPGNGVRGHARNSLDTATFLE